MYTRRHSRIYEKVFLSSLFQLLVGYVLLFTFSIFPFWGYDFRDIIDDNSKNAFIYSCVAFSFSHISLRRLLKYPGSQSTSFVIPTVSICYLLILTWLIIVRDNYSNSVLGINFFITLFWCYAGYFFGNRYRLNRYAVVPFGQALELKDTHNALFVTLTQPDLSEQRFNAIIADFRSNQLSPEWVKFLAKCTLSRIPVFHSQQIIESLTGRVKIDRLSENELGALLPSELYEKIKRMIDLFFSIFLLPLLLPLFLLIGILIKLESTGSIFYVQQRMGFQGKLFSMLKFRSMYTASKGQSFTAGEQDPRITKIGKFIRKYRIDELPQVFNVIIGQMSFIGPRPESAELTEWYSKDVPFFEYRHVVRPGISGWAQVEQGYAAEVDGMKLKLEYDFYYIKHFSLWLDILITFKTIKTILTGFGAR
ncbi:exopolysaccharide biosynthesis polyprenyl glycosylphosphotransferase [Leptospira sp. GIMC2001]|uniref:exopolysaccharide biosynthesis polyprenyl glycosylphosphotransferase n=1 Tax=Leptospira sp. GIMC2001 TaxID=1513297 RepID=UPI0023493D5F|nr:exopolysaccharide biosynthesis polyprenyl glycosylphosphotransferase [Leptospira sp. GIMC2001]WCL51341.1 exopolysaccharide biosynthesis polyprenyl glycosylphosphotransferase [Leptospira sp. GIMC2001]